MGGREGDGWTERGGEEGEGEDEEKGGEGRGKEEGERGGRGKVEGQGDLYVHISEIKMYLPLNS